MQINTNTVLSRLKAFCKVNQIKIFARKCTIKPIDIITAHVFLTLNHLEGSGIGDTNYGLFYKDELVAVMTFHKDLESDIWEITRFCSKKDTSIIGGASKLFKYFTINNDPNTVTCYSDLRWGNGMVFQLMGFKHITNIKPTYQYVSGTKRISKFSIIDDNTKLDKIWDCGNAKWMWTNML